MRGDLGRLFYTLTLPLLPGRVNFLRGRFYVVCDSFFPPKNGHGLDRFFYLGLHTYCIVIGNASGLFHVAGTIVTL